jgi:hypothetical protein
MEAIAIVEVDVKNKTMIIEYIAKPEFIKQIIVVLGYEIDT